MLNTIEFLLRIKNGVKGKPEITLSLRELRVDELGLCVNIKWYNYNIAFVNTVTQTAFDRSNQEVIVDGIIKQANKCFYDSTGRKS